jgi:hypothetical protein
MATEELCSVEIVGCTIACYLQWHILIFRIAVTHDFYPDRRFKIGGRNTLRYRKPSSPRVPTGISFDTDGVHYGWIREGCRAPIDRYLESGEILWCEVTWLGHRFQKFDNRLSAVREWRFATAICYRGHLPPQTTDSLPENRTP